MSNVALTLTINQFTVSISNLQFQSEISTASKLLSVGRGDVFSTQLESKLGLELYVPHGCVWDVHMHFVLLSVALDDSAAQDFLDQS